MVDYRCLDGLDPLKWSGGVAELFLLDWVPRKLTAVDATLDKAPEVLDAWVAWAGPRAGLSERAIAQTRAVIDDVRAETAGALRDTSNWGPAKQVAMSMVADGVDPADSVEVEEWIARYNQTHSLSKVS
ncbi:MAG: hypothetical protein ACYDGN_15310 [Acidimicrobiales bacterium]